MGQHFKLYLTTLAFASASAFGANILVNPGFETGSLSPWAVGGNFCSSPCTPWTVSNAQAHSGTFSAMDVGNIELVQMFSPTAVSSITQVSFWLMHPDGAGTPTAVDFIYSDNPTQEFGFSSTDAGWDFFDVTSDLAAGKTLTGIGIWGFSGGGTQQTFVDDLLVNAGPSVPEPHSLSLTLLGLVGLMAFAIIPTRWSRAAYWLGRRTRLQRLPGA